MKKSLLILMLLVLVVALVACGGEKTPEVTEGEDTPAVTTEGGETPATTTAAPVTTTAAPSKFTVKFVDADQFGNAVINESTVARGKAARAPLDPSHEGYIFLGWDIEDFSSITADTTITATYRPVDTYSVTFYDADGKALAAPITVKEGASVTAPQAPVIYGKIFDSWDKQIGQVDRAWPDFEQYKNLSAEEIAKKPLEYKVTATYKDADGVIAYKSSISMELKESKDANGKKIYVPADEIFTTTATYQSDDDRVYKGAGAEDVTNCKATVAVAWDGSYIYAYARVYDPTLLSRGQEYVMANDNAWETDGIEVWYSLGVAPGSNQKQLLRSDAWGYRKTAGVTYYGYDTTSVYFNEIEFQFKQADESNTYYAMFKMPAKTEAGEALKAGDICYFSMQINDLRSTTDLTNLYCSGTNSKFENWYTLTIGEIK
jgi:hypothetical protein